MDKGAHFYRCDFQVHTPRDRNWHGTKATSEEERCSFAKRFINHCRQIGLHAVAITDHHDTVFYHYIKEASENELDSTGNPVPQNQKIVVFPGIEISIANPPSQLLVLFDPNIDVNIYDNIPIRLGIVPSPKTSPSTCAINQLNISVQDIVNRLSEDPNVMNKCIILPNVKPGGYKTFLRDGYHTVFRELPCVGGYIEGLDYNEIGIGDRNILEGKVPAWSKRAYAIFQTSDSREDSLNRLGSFSTWVKWSTPSAEAIRQACLSRSCRISHNPPQLPNVYIKKVEVSNSIFLGPCNLYLNPQFNAFIGGRGTGKSSLLEYIRWGLCDPSYATDGEEPHVPAFEKKRINLIANTLEAVGGKVTIEWKKNNVTHKVVRDSSTKSIMLSIGDGNPREATAEEINTLIGIQAYSQKQLSTVGVQLSELRRFLETPIQGILREHYNKDNALASNIHRDIIRIQDRKRCLATISECESVIESSKKQVSDLKKRVKGLAVEHMTVVKQHSNIEHEYNYIADIRLKLEQLYKTQNDFINAIDAISDIREVSEIFPNQEILNHLRNEINQLSKNLKIILDQAKEQMQSSKWRLIYHSWETKYLEHIDLYNKAIHQNKENEKILKEIEELNNIIKDKEVTVLENRAMLNELGDPEFDFQNNLKLKHELYVSVRNLLEEQCSKLTEQSLGLIYASLAPGGDTEGLVTIIREAFQGSNVSNEKIIRLVQSLKNVQNPYEHWKSILLELKILCEITTDKADEVVLPDLPILRNAGFIDSELKRIAIRLNTDKYLNLINYRYREKPIFKYCIAEGEQIDFDQASAGQQASALLRVLLTAEGPPLLIDQPEDDLDNEIIASIAESIWESKKKRQLIFASHNANLVVNGDADLVVHFGYRTQANQSAGEIKHEGSIDMPNVKEAIKSVMEGGEQAFKLRLEKYGF